MMMKATFALDDFGDEGASMEAASQGRAPEEREHLWGRVTLESEGQPVVPLRDDLSMMGLALCVDVPAALAREGRATLRIVGWPGEYQFAAEGPDQVRLSGSRGEEALFPREPLVQALRACGERLAAFMAELAAQSSPQFDFSARALADALLSAPPARS